MLKRIRDAQLMPLRAPELVESQHVDVFDGIIQTVVFVFLTAMFTQETME